MADLHWFPQYAERWLSSKAINQMLPEQEGAYFRLLNIMWLGAKAGEPSLPAEDDALAVMSRLGKRWKKLGPLIRRQFVERDGVLYNEVLSEVWRDQTARHARAVERARKGGKARRKSASSRLQGHSKTTDTGIDIVLENQKDSLSMGAGALAPSGAPPQEHAVREVRNGGGAWVGNLVPKLAGGA